MHSELTRIRFPQSLFPALRRRLLADPTREAFAVLFAQRHSIAGATIYRVVDVHYPRANDYDSRGQAHLRIHRAYIRERLAEVQHRADVDTLIDVHTHPFSPSGANFSAVDDRDEKTFAEWLSDTVDELHFASIVLSRSDYAARDWQTVEGIAMPRHAEIRTQILAENWPDAVAS
jgi:molybdopterin-synthase adenylyltransferase